MLSVSRKEFEEKFEKSTLVQEASETRLSVLIKERDQFANLALERGKALEVLKINWFEMRHLIG